MKNKRACFGIVSTAFLLTVVAPAFAAGNLANLAPDRSLVISDGSRFAADQKLPRFSWDVTPQYFMFGDGARVLRPEEVSSIAARTDFVCIEKSHGLKELGAAELGAKHEAAAFKKIGSSRNRVGEFEWQSSMGGPVYGVRGGF